MTRLQDGMILWFDEWLWLDGQSPSTQCHTWRLPPERWHDFGNSIQAQFQFDYWALGPGAANLNIGIEQSPVRTLDDDAWTYLVSPGQIPLARLDDAASRIVGENGSVFDAYPRGWGRVMVKNSSNTGTANDWCAVRVRCLLRLQPADAAAALARGGC